MRLRRFALGMVVNVAASGTVGCSFPTGEFRLGGTSDIPSVTDRPSGEVATDVVVAVDALDAGGAVDATDVPAMDSATEAAVEAGTDDVAEVGADTGDLDATDVPAIDAGDDAPDVPVDVPGVDVADVIECPQGQTLCGASCVELLTESQHCGRCGNRCNAANATNTCAAGLCAFQCMTGFADCDMNPANGCEANLSSPLTCGSCGTRCNNSNGTPTCVAGACGITCAPGFGDCDNNPSTGCEQNTNATVSHCGRCGNACGNANGAPQCASGACTIACVMGFGNCDGVNANGCETATTSDVTHCGACNNRCAAGQSCVRGGCTTVCPDTMCGAQCVDVNTNVQNCGMCGRVCVVANSTPRCVGGTCGFSVCSPGFGNCDMNAANGCEANVQSDVTNCGTCGNRCTFLNAAATCANGACGLGACNPGFGNCDGNNLNGCETNLSNDAANCGRCSNRCTFPNASAVCSASNCALGPCTSGFLNCDAVAATGCEVNGAIDTFNCGSCNSRCVSHIGGSNACTASRCAPTCNTGFANCDGNVNNGCEANLATNSSCQVCGRFCSLTCSSTGLCSGASPGNYSRSTLGRAYVDACSLPGRVILLPGVDDGTVPFALPFAFRYYTTSYGAGFQVGVSSNGFLNFTATSGFELSGLIPSPTTPNGVVAAFLTDIVTGSTGVCVGVQGGIGARSAIFQWANSVYFANRSSVVNFEIILNEGSNTIDFLYQAMPAPPTRYQPAIGVENQTGVTATVFCNGVTPTCVAPSNTAFRFTPF